MTRDLTGFGTAEDTMVKALGLDDDWQAIAGALAAALQVRRRVKDRTPSHRGQYVEHGPDEEELHDLDEACDICAALVRFEEATRG